MIDTPYAKFTYRVATTIGDGAKISLYTLSPNQYRCSVQLAGLPRTQLCESFEDGLDWCEIAFKEAAGIVDGIIFQPQDVDSHYRLLISDRDRKLKQAAEILSALADIDPSGPELDPRCKFCGNWIAKHSEDCPYEQAYEFTRDHK